MDVTRLVSYIIDDSLPRFVAPRAHLLAPERSSRPTRARVTCTRDPTCSLSLSLAGVSRFDRSALGGTTTAAFVGVNAVFGGVVAVVVVVVSSSL